MEESQYMMRIWYLLAKENCFVREREKKKGIFCLSFFQDQSQAILDSSQFLNEINHFKIRLDTLEKERFELEDKVRRLQVCLLDYDDSERDTNFLVN